MSNKKTGGPAFPVPGMTTEDVYGNREVIPAKGGMSLRDYFAAKAMQGMFAADTDSSVIPPAKKAQYAYEAADAMLEARNE